MLNLLVAAGLVALLTASAVVWAVSHALGPQQEPRDSGMMRVRLWVVAMSLALVVVCALAGMIALFTHDSGVVGVERLLFAMSSTAVVTGLRACAVVALYPAYLCARVWHSESGRTVERLHLSAHLGLVYMVIAALLDVRGPVG
jgi:hypothetical protein